MSHRFPPKKNSHGRSSRPHLRGHIDHGRRGGRQGRLQGDSTGPQQPDQRKNEQKWGVNGKNWSFSHEEWDLTTQQSVYLPIDMVTLPTGIWLYGFKN